MHVPLALLVLFALGIFYDVLWTLYIRAVSQDRRGYAAGMSGFLTAFGFVAWSIMVETKMESTILGIVAYSLGGALGTFLTFRRKPEAVGPMPAPVPTQAPTPTQHTPAKS